MIKDKMTKHNVKKSVKKRLWHLCFTLPLGVGFAVLFYWLKLNDVLQFFLTLICWGAVFGAVELVCYFINKSKSKKQIQDPFGD